MKSKQKHDFESAVGKLNAAYFFRECTFSTNTFKPNPANELELADKVVWLDDLMILSQIKERIAPPDTTADKERKWFTDEVVKKATRHRCTRAVSFDLNSRSPLCQFLVFDKTPSSPDGRFV